MSNERAPLLHSYDGLESQPNQKPTTFYRWKQILKPFAGTLVCATFAAVAIIALVIIFVGTVEEEVEPPTNVTLGQAVPINYVDIRVRQGRLRGYTKQSRQGRYYYAFYKVPYAEPPLGSLRFKDPEPPKRWRGLRDEYGNAPQCIQQDKYSATPTVAGEEDCLYANVFTPSLPSSGELFPVIVYFHGGGTLFGNASRYDPRYWMDEDVVIITSEFRLGPFGFLDTQDDSIHGNMGLKDQAQVLQWAKENAEYFNGDPNLVTIAGHSAGATWTTLHMLSPLSQGLFHRAISMSGNTFTLSYMAPGADSKTVAGSTWKEVARIMDCDSEDSEKFWECMRDKPADDIVMKVGWTEPGYTYVPTVEMWRDRRNNRKFIPDKPSKLFYDGNSAKVPLLIGNTNSEYGATALPLLQNETILKMMNERFEEMNGQLLLNLSKNEMGAMKEFYFGSEEISVRSLWKLGDLMSDRQMVHPTYATARYQARDSDTFLYWVTKAPNKSYADKFVKGFPAKDLGMVYHADEMEYFFLIDGFPEITKDDQEYFEYSKMMVKLWVDFCKTGVPKVEEVDWPKVNAIGDGNANSTFWMELSDTPKLTSVVQERMGFWDRFDYEHELLYNY